MTPRDVLRRLRRHHLCQIRAGELLVPSRFVLDPVTGGPVAPVPAQLLTEHQAASEGADAEVVLFIPEDIDGAMQLLATPIALDPRTHEGADRSVAYHGPPVFPRWALFEIETVRCEVHVFSGGEVVGGNPLRTLESRVCRALNADPSAVVAACARLTGTEPAAPMVVGVDPDGIDVRARFGIIRLDFMASVEGPEGLSSALASLGCRWSQA